MDPDNNFKKTLIKNIGIAAGILLIIFGGIFFLRSHIRESVSQITDIRQELAENTATLNSLSRLRSQYNEYGEDYLNVLSNVVPNKDALVDISQDYQALASEEGVGFGFSFLSEHIPENESDLGYIEFRLNITAESLDEAMSFIERVRNFQYLTTVDSVNIDRNRSLGEINMLLQGKVYYQ